MSKGSDIDPMENRPIEEHIHVHVPWKSRKEYRLDVGIGMLYGACFIAGVVLLLFILKQPFIAWFQGFEIG